MLCPNCNSEMRLVKAGISRKTNKPYNAFFSCPNCGQTFNPPKDIADKVGVENFKPYKSREVLDKEKADRIEFLHNDKKQGINWTSAMGRAVDLISRHPAFAKYSESELWKIIIEYRDLIYREYTGQNKEEGIDHSSDDIF